MCGFFVHTEDDRITRRVQVESHDVGRLAGELGVGAHTPAAPPPQLDPMPAHDPPDVAGTHVAQRCRQQPARPGGVPWGRRRIQLRQDPPLGHLSVFRRRPRPRRIHEPRQPLPSKPRAPLRDPRRPRPQVRGDALSALPLSRRQNHPRALDLALLTRARPRPGGQRRLLLVGQGDPRGYSAHARHSHPVTADSRCRTHHIS